MIKTKRMKMAMFGVICMVFVFTIVAVYVVGQECIYSDTFLEHEQRKIYSKPEPSYQFDCQNINDIKILEQLSNGITKTVYLGIYNEQKVAVKMPSAKLNQTSVCINEMEKRNITSFLLKRCKDATIGTMLQEIRVMQQLKHDNLVRLLGFCVRNTFDIEHEDLRRNSFIAVTEFGQPLSTSFLTSLQYAERLRHASEMASLMLYLSGSPVGALYQGNFELGQFVVVDGHIKLNDIDTVHAGGPHCDETNVCKFNAVCNMTTKTCVQYNNHRNMFYYMEIFDVRFLRPELYPSKLQSSIQEIYTNVQKDNITFADLVTSLEKIRKIH